MVQKDVIKGTENNPHHRLSSARFINILVKGIRCRN